MDLRTLTQALTITVGLALSTSALAGRIVVNHDEWTFSPTGQAQAGLANVNRFAANLAGFMNSNGGACSFLVYSTNTLAYANTTFQNAMAAAGCGLTFNTGPFDSGVATLANYDGVFLALNPGSYNVAALTNYINAGGSAYIAAGTGGAGGAVGEAAVWNPFLQQFGLQFGSPYNGCCNNDAVEGTHPLLTGVSQLYYNNGNTVSLFGSNPNASVIEFNQGRGLLGVYDDVVGVPAPATVLLGIAVVALGSAFRRRLA